MVSPQEKFHANWAARLLFYKGTPTQLKEFMIALGLGYRYPANHSYLGRISPVLYCSHCKVLYPNTAGQSSWILPECGKCLIPWNMNRPTTISTRFSALWNLPTEIAGFPPEVWQEFQDALCKQHVAKVGMV